MSEIRPVIPLPGKVFFPQTDCPLIAKRDLSVKAVRRALEGDGVLVLLNQKDSEKAKPHPNDMFRVGIVGKIVDSYAPDDGTIRVAIASESRATVLRCFEENGYLQAEVETISEASSPSGEVKSLMETAIDTFENERIQNLKK